MIQVNTVARVVFQLICE